MTAPAASASDVVRFALRALVRVAALATVAAAATAAAAAGGSASAPVNANLDDVPALEAFFDGAMELGMQDHHVTGAVVSIVKDGRVLFAKGYGKGDLARKTPIDPATSLFRIGSTTKTFTWTAVMQLVEQGKLDLDKDVNAYLQGLRIPDTYPQPVTMRHLMTHTAGFEEGFVGYLEQTDAKHHQPLAQFLREHMPKRVQPPGVMSAYSNYGAALAGLIVEQVSGIPYPQYIDKNIFEPLEMHFATVEQPLPQRLEPYMTTGYKFVNGGHVAQPFEVVAGFAPAGAGSVSALDMTHFMLAHLQGGRYGDRQILRPETVRLMQTPAFAPEPRFPGMALGFYHQNVNGRDAFGHGGDTILFHTEMLLLPQENVGLFLSFITDDGRVREKVEQAFFDRYFPPVPERSQRLPDSQARALAAGYAGRYQLTRRNFSAIDKVFNLFNGLGVSALENGNLLLTGLDPDGLQLEPIGADLYREVLRGQLQVSFRRDSSGHVTHMFFSTLPFMPAERQPWYEQSAFWGTLLGAAGLVFLGTLAATYYRWREIRLMPPQQQRALWIAAAVAGWALASFAVLAGVVAATGLEGLISHIPPALSAALLMPLVLLGLTAWLILVTIRVWRQGLWTTGRRIGYTLTAFAALILCVFFWRWNLLGWHYG